MTENPLTIWIDADSCPSLVRNHSVKMGNKLGLKNIIATHTDIEGNIIGENCKGKEKIKRLEKEFPNVKVKSAYSDSKADIPMLEYAKVSYVVEGDKLLRYKKGYKFTK